MEVQVCNVSKSAVAKELVEFLESHCGAGTVVSCLIQTAHGNWMSKGFGSVQFSSETDARRACELAEHNALVFQGRPLRVQLQRRSVRARGSVRVEGLTLCMGVMASGSVMEFMWSCSKVAAEFCFGRHSQLNLILLENGCEYKLELQFKELSIVNCYVDDCRSLLLKLFRPPHVYVGVSSKQVTPVLDNPAAILRHYKAIRANNYSYSYSKFVSEPVWIRTTDFTPVKAISQSLVYWLEFADVPEASLQEVSDGLRNFYASNTVQNISLVPGKPYASQQELIPIMRCTDKYDLPLEVVYKLNFAVQSGCLSPPAVNDQLLSLLRSFPEERCVSALDNLISPTRETVTDAVARLQALLQDESLALLKPDEDRTYVKRLLVTPTKVYCTGPEIEGSNRITRKYRDLIGSFLRVSFVDEDFGPLHADATCVPKKISWQDGLLPESTEICRRVLTVVRDGVRIGGKHFRFLAFSPSQLRQRSLWMFADTGDVTADSIRKWMGNFDNFTNVAKCAARMGQSFSSSQSSLAVQENELSLIDDVEKRDGGVVYCFSDGIGKISKSFATSVARECRMHLVPSAFQIRYGGYKGVVAVDPTSTSKLSLRPSMMKFPSEQTALDVLKWTQYAPYYLNRQIIILMSTMGVPEQVFLELQMKEISLLDKMLQDPTMAAEVIGASSSGEAQLAVDMLSAGYLITKEPFLKSLVASFRALQLYLLRIKTRIYVPKGRCLMGCLDETVRLEYGQVFVQVSPTPGPRSTIDDGLRNARPGRGVSGQQNGCVVLGKVVIAKNPCMHPGDLLVLEAVDVPGLHHMIDCVVFPQRGKRPHPNECSGSDLDGDLYFVSWDESLIPPSKYEPMSYEPSGTMKLDHSVTLEEIQEFFVDTMAYDSLGVISNAHLVHADKEEMRARHPKCLELAKLASAAVDFPKTGIPAVIPVDLRPRDYPDFMENEVKATYKSTSVLGTLYRSLNYNGSESKLPITEESIQEHYDGSLLVTGYEKHVPDAVARKRVYDGKLRRLLNQYEVSEGEIVTGNVLRFTRVNEKQRGDTKDRITFAMKGLVKEVGSWFKVVDESEQAAKAYAWYHVTYHPDYRKPEHRNKELLSFPWVVNEVATHLLTSKKRRRIP